MKSIVALAGFRFSTAKIILFEALEGNVKINAYSIFCVSLLLCKILSLQGINLYCHN